MKKCLKTLFDNFEIIFSSIFIIITTVLVLVNVVMRYFFHSGIYWTVEVTTSCFVWSVFLGAAGAYRRNMHIGVDILVNKLPETLRKIVETIVKIILLVINAYILYLSIIFVKNSYIKPTQVLGISSAWVSSSLIVSFGLTTIYSIQNLILSLKSFAVKKEA